MPLSLLQARDRANAIERESLRQMAQNKLHQALRELKGFRHIFRHAYDLTLILERLESLVKHAEELAAGQPTRIESFIREVQTTLGADATEC